MEARARLAHVGTEGAIVVEVHDPVKRRVVLRPKDCIDVDMHDVRAIEACGDVLLLVDLECIIL